MGERRCRSRSRAARAAHAPAGPCAIAAACGGCALIDAPYAEQLEHKREPLAGARARYPELGDVVMGETVEAREPLGDRTRAKLACARDGAKLRVGLYEPGTHEVTDTPGPRLRDTTLGGTGSALVATAIAAMTGGVGVALAPFVGAIVSVAVA